MVAGSTVTANAAVETVTGVNVIGEVVETVQNTLVDLGIVSTHNGIDKIQGEWEDDEEEIVTTTVRETTSFETTTEQTTTQFTTTQISVTTTKAKPNIDKIQGEWEDDDETTTTTTTTTTKPTTTRRQISPTTEKPIVPTTKPNVKPDEPAPVVFTGLLAEFDNFKSDYVYGEELTYEGLTLYAQFSDGTKQPVSLDECDYTKNLDMTKTMDYTLRVIYNDCIVSINITVRPDDDTRGSQICENDLYDYLLTDKGAYVTAYRGNETNIVLSELDGNEVIAIGSDVYKGMDIEYFNGENVTKIFPDAFKGCTRLVDCYTPRAEYIGDSAFEDCENLKEAVFSDNLIYIGEWSYKGTAIKDIEIPSAISEIPKGLCEGCKELKKVVLKGEVTAIGRYAFSQCASLEALEGAENITIAEAFAFYEDSLLAMDSKLDKLEGAGEYAFYKCNKLDIGTLPSIKSIDKGSFGYCYLLKEVTIPESITKIPYACFNGTRLEKIVLHNRISEIGDFAFMSTMISTVDIPSSVQKIGTRAFYTTRMRNVYFYNKNVAIDDEAFYQGSRLMFYVYENSTAHIYAEANDINYELMKDPSVFDGIDHFLGDFD